MKTRVAQPVKRTLQSGSWCAIVERLTPVRERYSNAPVCHYCKRKAASCAAAPAQQGAKSQTQAEQGKTARLRYRLWKPGAGKAVDVLTRLQAEPVELGHRIADEAAIEMAKAVADSNTLKVAAKLVNPTKSAFCAMLPVLLVVTILIWLVSGVTVLPPGTDKIRSTPNTRLVRSLVPFV